MEKALFCTIVTGLSDLFIEIFAFHYDSAKFN